MSLPATTRRVDGVLVIASFATRLAATGLGGAGVGVGAGVVVVGVGEAGGGGVSVFGTVGSGLGGPSTTPASIVRSSPSAPVGAGSGSVTTPLRPVAGSASESVAGVAAAASGVVNTVPSGRPTVPNVTVYAPLTRSTAPASCPACVELVNRYLPWASVLPRTVTAVPCLSVP